MYSVVGEKQLLIVIVVKRRAPRPTNQRAVLCEVGAGERGG